MIELGNPIIARRTLFNLQRHMYKQSMLDEFGFFAIDDATKHGMLPNISAMLDEDENKYTFLDVSNNNGYISYDPSTQTFNIDGELQLVELMEYFILYATSNADNITDAKSKIYDDKDKLTFIITMFDGELYTYKLRLLNGESVVDLTEENVQYAKGKGGRIFANNLKLTHSQYTGMVATLAPLSKRNLYVYNSPSNIVIIKVNLSLSS